MLVVPIDKAAPKGRLILPQQQTIRDILEADAVSVVVRENGLRDTLASLGKKPRMVITDRPGICKGQCRYAGGYSPDLLFHSLCPL